MTLILLSVVVFNLAYIGLGLLRYRRMHSHPGRIITWPRIGGIDIRRTSFARDSTGRKLDRAPRGVDQRS
jgi:hypothetical protein